MNQNLFPALRPVFFASVFSVLSACGGGGGGGNSSPGDSDLTPAPEPGSVTLTGDSSANRYDSVGIVASLSETGYNRYEWEQLSGPTVTLAGQGTAGISFDAPSADTYGFRFTATNRDGDSISDSYSMLVSSGGENIRAHLRADRAVSEGADFSLRLMATGLSSEPSDWEIRQVSGPSATLEVDDYGVVAFVNAPMVSRDQVLEFEAVLTVAGRQYTDTAYVVVQDRPEVTSEYFCDGDGDYCATDAPLNNVYTYRSDSPYRDYLADCVYSNQLVDESFCTLGKLPVIGTQSDMPTVDQIMDHVLVSHDWMGARFETFLREMDPYGDFARLLRATTAIVISSDIRPSFYWSLTGAIYLDPDSLWLTPAERDVINEQPDYRSGFGSSLQFATPWRYVRNNNYAFTSYPPVNRESRTLREVETDLGSLLYHELAHANDAMSPAKIDAGLDSGDIFFNQASSGNPVNVSVANINPLQSLELFELAEVRYRGTEASLEQKTYRADDIAGFFFPDSANDFYAYSTDWEDTAMLFEETMMSLRYGIQRDIAVTNLPINPQSADDYVVAQGQRSRIGDEYIGARAGAAVQALLPEAWAQADDHLRGLTPISLCAGEGWAQNLNPACAGSYGVLRYEVPAPSGEAPMPVQMPRSFNPPTRF